MTATRWSGVAEAYRSSFATLCAGTVDRLLADADGERLLDVGSGTGELAARAAAAGRTVLAVDGDPDMVAMTGAAVPGRALLAALPLLPLEDAAVDAVTANFVVNHVPDPRAAVRELARVTRPGGRVALTIWPAAPTAWGELVSRVFAGAGVVPLPGARLPPELDFERSVSGLRGLAEGAGLEVVVAEELRWTWAIGSEQLWTGLSGGVGVAGATYLAQPPAVRAAVAENLRREAARTAPDGVLRFPVVAAYVVAARLPGERAG